MNSRLIKKSLIRSGALRFASQLAGPGVAIVMYHSVLSDPASAFTTLGDVVHSADIFRGQMEVVSREFHAVTLDDVFLFLQAGKALPSRPVVVTFDDGYADNHAVAREILDRLGIPGTFYVAVDSIDRQQLPWTARLRYAFLTSKRETWREIDGTMWSLQSNEQRQHAFYRAAQHCSRLTATTQERFVDSTERDLETSPLRPLQRPMMTWDELRALARSGHTIGSHTMTHPNVAHISEKEVHSELKNAKRRLEEELSVPAVHFAYPCPALQPHWTTQTVSACREAGYQTAVTTNRGLVRRQDDPLSMRRIRPTKTVDGFRWNLECAFLRRRRSV